MGYSHWPGLEQGAGLSPSKPLSLRRQREGWLSTKKRWSGHSPEGPRNGHHLGASRSPEAVSGFQGLLIKILGFAKLRFAEGYQEGVLLERKAAFLLLGE